jgi:hypothetical protein|tara:strand:+ start:43 stop:534 length:492 start_codon:yes stop_codon:yes gene_type:complete
MRFAYADPPYPGMAHRYPENTEVDHAQLIAELVDGFPDGWALSTSSVALQQILALCPMDVRVMAWVKPFAVFKQNVNPAYAWEPVIVQGGRKRTRSQLTVRDWVAVNITLRKGVVGAKPEGFCQWLFQVLNVEDGDELVDLYPGTGIVTTEFDRLSTAGVLFA